jgi:aspartate 1-decarboxylase
MDQSQLTLTGQRKVDILPNEQVDVLNINTGSRFTTYVIESRAGSKTIGINGAAVRLA